jgi:hypothetical protein
MGFVPSLASRTICSSCFRRTWIETVASCARYNISQRAETQIDILQIGTNIIVAILWSRDGSLTNQITLFLSMFTNFGEKKLCSVSSTFRCSFCPRSPAVEDLQTNRTFPGGYLIRMRVQSIPRHASYVPGLPCDGNSLHLHISPGKATFICHF